MRILFIVPYPPSVIRARSYNQIKFLAARGHEITLATVYTGSAELENIDAIRPYCQDVIAYPLPKWRSALNCLRVLPTKKPLQSVFSWHPALFEQIKLLLDETNRSEPFAVIHIEHLRGGAYGLAISQYQSSQNYQIPIVWDSVDCITYLFEQAVKHSTSRGGRLMTRLDLERTRYYELWLAKQFDHVLITSEKDKQALLALPSKEGAAPPVTVLPIGVDTDYFKPDSDILREPETLIITGKMSYHANITMVLYMVNEVMPLIWQRNKSVKLVIVGKGPSREIQSLHNGETIIVTGTVPEMKPWLQKATIAVVPMRYGAGLQFKIIEAMACGTPVIASKKAIQSLTLAENKDLLVADSATEFAEKIINLLDQPEVRRCLAANGRVYVEKHFAWSRIAEQLEGIYNAAFNKTNRTQSRDNVERANSTGRQKIIA